MKKLLALSLVLLLASACGGGGGGVAPTPTDPPVTPPPGPTDAERAEEILEACVAGSFGAALDVADLLLDVLASSSTGFQITGGEFLPDSFQIDYELELAGGPPPDAFGSFRMFDDQGAPANPVGDDQNPAWGQLTGGINVLPGILQAAGVVDGSQLVMEYVGNDVLVANGQVGAGYMGNAPTTITGAVTQAVGGCATSFAWSAIPLANFPSGGIPTGAFTIDLQEGGDQLLGTLTADGTSTATAAVALNGGATINFTIDLNTGDATEI